MAHTPFTVIRQLDNLLLHTAGLVDQLGSPPPFSFRLSMVFMKALENGTHLVIDELHKMIKVLTVTILESINECLVFAYDSRIKPYLINKWECYTKTPCILSIAN
jgi:hypothetical protein